MFPRQRPAYHVKRRAAVASGSDRPFRDFIIATAVRGAYCSTNR